MEDDGRHAALALLLRRGGGRASSRGPIIETKPVTAHFSKMVPLLVIRIRSIVDFRNHLFGCVFVGFPAAVSRTWPHRPCQLRRCHRLPNANQ